MAISDIVNPEVVSALTNEKLATKLATVPGLDTSSEFEVGTPGTSWEVPYNKRLAAMARDGEGVTLTPQTMSQAKYKMVVQRAAQVYKDEDIAKMVATGDPAGNLSDRLAEVGYEYLMARRLDILEGAIPTANRYDPAAVISDTVLAVAKGKLGDHASDLKAALMHSSAYNYLERTGKIVYQPISNVLPLYSQTNFLGANGSGLVPTCAGLVLMQSDAISAEFASTVYKYPTYLLGMEAMGMYWQKNSTLATYRDEITGGGYTGWVYRLPGFVMCLHGVSYDESTSPQLYTSAALKATANYALKWDQKLVKAVRVLTKVA